MNIKKGDKVVVIAGKNKGETGVVTAAFPKASKVKIEGLNLAKKHMKPSQANEEGGIVEFEAPIHVSNVQILDPVENVATRIGQKFVEDKDGQLKKVRYAKKSGEILDK